MAVLNLRGIPDELARMVKATAASEGKTLVEFATELFERDVRRGGWTAGKKNSEGNNAEIATGGSAGVAAAGISPEGKRGVQKGAAGDHGKLLRGQSVSGAAAAEAGAGGNAEAVAPPKYPKRQR